MNTSRRSFIRNSSLLIAGTALLSKTAFASAKPNEIMGLQLYSVRDDMMKDPKGTLKQVAEIGYKHVEHAGYTDGKFYGYTPVEFKKVMDDFGLKMPCGHTVMGINHWDAAKKDFTDVWKKTVEDAATVGQQYVVSPWMDEAIHKNYDSFMNFLDLFNQCGALCRKSGMKFGYHNHWFEFTEKLNGTLIFDLMMQNLNFDLFAMQLDMGNMYIAGAKASDVLNQYPGKFELLHVKDEIASTNAEKFESAVLGKGVINAKEATDLARKIGGTKIYIVEQEAYQQLTPLQAVKEDFKVMKQWGF
ncbi:MAG TPA: sugar phosphate isomerase/epimerase family protein [Prolixibacteraceae bacterium]|nr:sugar phosphate isomerase/epimerase family protein [Prolixibacteraceae bacterium]